MKKQRRPVRGRRHDDRAERGSAKLEVRSAAAHGQLQTRWARLASVVCLICYWALFYLEPLPSQRGLLRLEVLGYVFMPDHFFGMWFGDGSQQVAVLDRLPIVLVAAAILAFSFVPGRLLLESLGVDRGLTRLERFVFSMGVGLNVVSLLTLTVGLVGWLHNPLAFAVPAAAVLVVAGRRWNRHWFEGRDKTRGRHTLNLSRSQRETGLDWFDRSGLWLGVPFVLVILFGSMLPPVDFDVREYHSQVPKEWYQQGTITFLPHNVYGNMPLGAEMHSLLAMVIMPGQLDWWWGALAGKTVIAAFAPLAALALFAAGRRFVSNTAGVVAAVVYISVPWIGKVSINGLIEGVVAFYLLLGLYALLLWSGYGGRQGEDPHGSAAASPSRNGLLLLAGFMAGGAASCKYPATLFVVLPLAVWVLLWCPRSEVAASSWRVWHTLGGLNWKPVAVFLLAVVCGCGLWFGKNWLLTGNPTYPLLVEVFGGQTRTLEKHDLWRNAHAVPPYSLREFSDGVTRILWRSEWHSPLLIPLIALSLYVPRHRRLVLLLWAMFGYVVLIWWLFTHRIDRFWVPVLPVVALLAGIGATWQYQPLWRHLLLGVMFWGLIANFVFVASPVAGVDNRLFVSLEDLRVDRVTTTAAHRYLNSKTTDDSTVLLVGDAEPFDLETPVLYNTCFDDCIFEQLIKGRTRQQRLDALQQRKVSYVYVRWSEILRYRKTYGYGDYVQKEVFDQLQEQGILELDDQFDQFAARGEIRALQTADSPEEFHMRYGQLFRVVE